MKIARNVGFSGRSVEWNPPLPAPSLRELSSECETEGVYFDERKRLKISEFICAGSLIIGPNQPSNDTPSVSPCGLPAPSEREPGWGRSPAPSLREPSSECETEGVYFDERKRLKISEFICAGSLIIGPEQPSDDTPSVTPFGRASSLREGAGNGCVPFNRVLAKIRGYGRFSSPLRNSESFTFQHSTGPIWQKNRRS